MSTVQAIFLLPVEVLASLRALEHSFGAWKKAEHPELKSGTEAFIRRQRVSTKKPGIKQVQFKE
ncbi:MAG: hypothetical protein NTV89_04890 [Proteobacteria bacterium]|nr:hypothetical protein [Pseudomonadota bacterium]